MLPYHESRGGAAQFLDDIKDNAARAFPPALKNEGISERPVSFTNMNSGPYCALSTAAECCHLRADATRVCAANDVRKIHADDELERTGDARRSHWEKLRAG